MRKRLMLGVAALAALSMTPVFAGGDKDAALAANGKSFDLVSTVNGESGFKVFGLDKAVTYRAVIDDDNDTSDAAITTEKNNIKIVAGASNKAAGAGNDFSVTASATPLSYDGCKTPMGYTLYVDDAGTEVKKDHGAESIDIMTVSSGGTATVVQKTLAAAITQADYDTASQGSYRATITFTVAAGS